MISIDMNELDILLDVIQDNGGKICKQNLFDMVEEMKQRKDEKHEQTD